MPADVRFFFYGTLVAGSGNPVAQAAHARLCPIGRASVLGTLWGIPDPAGWYPALISGRGQVHGMLYAVGEGFGPDDLARLDDWEDYRPDQPAESLYLREEMQVTIAGGAGMPAQAYRFNQPLPDGALAISDGDFRAWLSANGYGAYR